MKTKHIGFTLIEVLIAIVLFSFVIMLSATFFDNILKQNYIQEKNIVNSSNISSIMENEIINLRNVASYYKASEGEKAVLKKPARFEEVKEPLTINENFVFINSKTVKNIQGYFVSANSSYDSSNNKFIIEKTKYNNISRDDDFVTFVALGHYESPVSSVQSMSFSSTKSFGWNSIDSPDMNISIGYNVTDPALAPNKTFHLLRVTPMISKLSNDNVILSYPDIYSGYHNYDIVAEASNFKDISSTNKPILTIKSYSSDKKEYLNYADKSLIISAFTLNKNGKTSPTTYTLSNEDINKKFIQLISLPYVNTLTAFYDYNLAISKSKDNKSYISLFDLANKDNTNFPDNFYKFNDVYKFNFNKTSKIDIRTFLDLSGSKIVNNDLNINESFVYEKLVKNDGGSTSIPYIKKSYGNTMYFDKSIATIQPSGPRTLFLKFNNENYNNEKDNKKDSQPFVILSNNINLSNGTFQNIKSGSGGYIIYVDTDNKIKYINWAYEYISRTWVANIKNSGTLYDLNDTNLYTDSDSFKFSPLVYEDKIKSLTDKRDGRQNFNILSIKIDTNPINTTIGILKRDISKSDLETSLEQLSSFRLNPLTYAPTTNLGGILENNISFYGGTVLNKQGNQSNIEVSDILMYNEDLSLKTQGNSNMLKCTMDYLYRKYLTDTERTNFDEYFVTTY